MKLLLQLKLKAEGIANVIISMGANGSLWLNDQAVIQAQPPKCENVVSTVERVILWWQVPNLRY